MMPDIQIADLTTDTDFIVLACDGVWDCLTSSQAVSFIEDKLSQLDEYSCEDNCSMKQQQQLQDSQESIKLPKMRYQRSKLAVIAS